MTRFSFRSLKENVDTEAPSINTQNRKREDLSRGKIYWNLSNHVGKIQFTSKGENFNGKVGIEQSSYGDTTCARGFAIGNKGTFANINCHFDNKSKLNYVGAHFTSKNFKEGHMRFNNTLKRYNAEREYISF